jgi:PAS domain S-box-containing protein
MPDLSPEDRDYPALVQAGKSFERTHLTKTGQEITFLVSLSLIDFAGRKLVLSLNRDIRERKRIEEAIAANEAKLRILVQSISEIILLLDDQGRIKFVSPQVERVLEFPVRGLLEQNIFEFIHPEDRARAGVEYAQTMQDPGESLPSALRVRSRSGEWIPFEIIANNQLNDPNIAAVIFTARDLRFRREAEATILGWNEDFDKRVEECALDLAKANAALRLEIQQRRHSEAQVKESLSLLHATLESTADGILVVSSDRLISGCNQRFLDMWNIPRMAVTGLGDKELLSLAGPLVEDHAFAAKVEDLYAKPEAVSYDVIKLKDGRIFERYTQPQRVGDDIVGRVWSFRDATAAHRLEEELRQSQKMEAMGRMAGGIAHDFNNLLMLIAGYDRQILADPQLPPQHRESGERLIDAIQRAASLTRKLLAFSRKQPIEPQLVDLNLIAAGMEKLLERLLQQSIQIKFNLHQGALPIVADTSQIELMIMNLVLNARDAMPNGGALTITTREEPRPESPKKGKEPSPPALAWLEVSDTGQGMEPGVKDHIFEPFFTTKGMGKGTGLGLSTVYGIVEQGGGRISVESEPGRGSTFRISFPIVPESRQEASKDHAGNSKANAKSAESSAIAKIIEPPFRETILLVEDEPGIRRMTRAYLESQGYTVLHAGGADAIRIAADYKDRIDLVVADVIMPGIHGADLVRAIRRDRPEVSAIYITGHPEPHKLDADVPVIEKPFEFPDLGNQIRKVLDAAGKHRARARKSA